MSTLLVIIALATFCTYVWLVVTAFGKSVGWGIAVMLFSPLAALIFAAMNFEEAKKPFAAFMVCFLITIFVVIQKASDFAEDAGFADMAAKAQKGEKISDEEMARNALRAMEKMQEKGFIGEADLAKARADFAAKFPPREEVASQAAPQVTPQAVPAMKEPQAAKPVVAAIRVEEAQSPVMAEPELSADQTLASLLDKDNSTTTASGGPGYRKVYTEVALSSLARKIGKLCKIIDKHGQQHIGQLLEVEPGYRLILSKSSGNVQYSMEILVENITSAMIQERLPN